jgi:hypothetical protein
MIDSWEEEAKYFAAYRPDQCPACGGERVAGIVYGLLDMSNQELKQKLDAEEVMSGGCMVTGSDPAWRCLDCGAGIHRGPRSDRAR